MYAIPLTLVRGPVADTRGTCRPIGQRAGAHPNRLRRTGGGRMIIEIPVRLDMESHVANSVNLGIRRGIAPHIDRHGHLRKGPKWSA